MKKSIRILSFALVLIMALGTLFACGGDKEPKETKKPGVSGDVAATIDSKWDDVNFDGTQIVIGLNDTNGNHLTSVGASTSVIYMQGPDGYTTDSVQNAIYDRNLIVSSALGIEPIYKNFDYSAGSADYVSERIEEMVLADLEDSPDIISATSYGLVRAGIKGNLYNALTTEEENNHFDIKQENGWYADFMYENTLDKNKLFILAGDYFVDVLRSANGILVNIDMYNNLFANEGGIDSLYETIEAGAWDYDELTRTAAAAHVDSGVIGTADDADTFGITASNTWFIRDFFCTAGLDVFEEVDGQVKYVEDIGTIHTFVDKMLEIAYADYVRNPFPYDKNINAMSIFVSGSSLYTLDASVLCLEGSNVRNMNQRVGILPFPKYYDDAPYRALVADSANTGGILYNSDKFVPCSAFLQLMCEESNDGEGTVIYEYYEVTLKHKYAVDPGQVKMLQIIRDGVCSPKAMLYDNFIAKNVGKLSFAMVIANSMDKGSNTFTSDWQSQVGAVQQSLDDVLTTFGDQE